jgi:hypothetical protein
MRGEVSRLAHHYTSPDWVNREGPALSPWPMAKKRYGDKSRVKSGQTAMVKAFLKKFEKGLTK